MSSSVLSRLSARLHTSPEETEQVLFALVDQIRRKVNEEGAAIVPDLGIFRQFNGNLVFEPVETLSVAVNYRFAGLEPVLLSPSSPPQIYRKREVLVESSEDEKPVPEPPPHPVAKQADDSGRERSKQESTPSPWAPVGNAPVQNEPTDPVLPSTPDDFSPGSLVSDNTIEEDAYGQPEPPPSSEIPIAGSPEMPGEDTGEDQYMPNSRVDTGPSTDELDETAEPAPPTAEERLEPPGPVHQGQPLFKEWTEDDFESEAVEENVENTDDAEVPVSVLSTHPEQEVSPSDRKEPLPPPPLKPAVRQPKPPAQRTRHFSIPLIIGIVFLVAFVGVLAFMFLSDTRTPVVDPESSIVEEVPTEPAPTDSFAASVPPQVETPGETIEAEPVTTSVWDAPLRSSDGIDGRAGGYTIIVASRGSQDAAQPAVEQYRGQGFRTSILHGAYRDVSRYRIGVGQFRTEAEANTALGENDSELPDDAWVMPVSSDLEILD